MDESMECKHGEQMTMLMSLSLDSMLDRDGQHRLERHLASCTACQREWQAVRQVSAFFEAEPMVGPPLGFAVRVERFLAHHLPRFRFETVSLEASIARSLAESRWRASSPSHRRGRSKRYRSDDMVRWIYE